MGILSKLKKWNKADYVLLGAGGVFLLAVAVKLSFPGSLTAKLFLTVAEAGLVGGIADWFAVTALFRRPFGFPYHTALVPRNRQRLIDALAKAVQEDFLGKEAIKKRLATANLTEWLIDRLENNNGAVAAWGREIITGLTQRAIISLDTVHAGRRGAEFIKKTLLNEPLTPHLAKAASWAANTGKTVLLYEILLGELSKIANQPAMRQKIYNYLQNLKVGSTSGNWFSSLVAWVMEETDSLNLGEAADILQSEILSILSDARGENHPVRRWFLEQATLTAASLADNPNWAVAVEAGKTAFLNKLDLARPLAAAAASLQEAAAEPRPDGQNLLESQIVDFLAAEAAKYWQVFKADRSMKEKTEKCFHYLTDSLLESSHGLIGTVVADALSRLTDRDFIRFVEEKAAEDLAWIRINGVVVGSLVGLLLGLFLHFVYEPFLR